MRNPVNNYDYSSAYIKKFSPYTVIEKNSINQYHYTSPDAFLSIIKNDSVRFTDIRFLNDRSEGIYLVKLMCDYFKKYPQKFPRTENAFNDLIKENTYSDIQNLKVTNVKYTPTLRVSNVRHFVFCMCAECDSLHMWNYYVNNGLYQGYNIGINIQQFLKTFTMGKNELDPFLVYYGNVLYNTKLQFKELENIFTELEQEKNFCYISVKLKMYIDTFCAFFKNSKFSDEKEFRIVIEINDSKVNEINKNSKNYIGSNNKDIKYDFCIKNGIIVPFLTVKLIRDSFKRITISPIMESQITQESIRELLNANGYKGCKVYQSIIPIRF